ncbi:MAG: hypothetical protein R3279_04875 [Putridiphycobacter sp.]|nr:hypothetical protein [Putridiphycobacter sp.]
MKFSLIFLTLVILLAACNKAPIELNCDYTTENIIATEDIIAEESNPYLAAYPGSWWQLTDGRTINCKQLIQQTYYNLESIDQDNCVENYTAYNITAPFLADGSPLFAIGFVDGGYGFSVNSSTSEFKKNREILKTDYIENGITDSWVVSSESSDGSLKQTVRKLNKKYNSFTAPNNIEYSDVIEIQQNFIFYDSLTETMHNDSMLFYYAKERGLFMVDYFDPIIPDIFVKYYYIAPH